MASCNFIQQDSSTVYVCTICGFSTKIANAYRVCKPPLSFGQKVINFIPALTSHILSGAPKSSPEEISRRLEICRGCPLFISSNAEKTAGICGHNACGCNIKDTQTFWNKIAWADQSCPIGRWLPVGSGNPS